MPRSNATPTDSTDSLPLTTRSSTDTPPPAPSPSPKRADSADSLETTHETAPMLARWDVGIDDDDDVGAVDEDSAELGLGLGESEGRPWGEWDEPARSHGRGKNRRVYGGGRHGDAMEGGVLGPGEVAGMILAATLGPTPLLLPHAAALLGLPLFLPLLFLTGGLSWFAYVVLGLEGRYTGSRSWPSLTSAVFPHRFQAHRIGELASSTLVFVGSFIRGVLGTVAASEVVVDLFIPAGGRRWWERVVVVTVIGLTWVLLPLLLLPILRRELRQRPGPTTSAAAALFRLPAYVALSLWPLALLVLGVRLEQLNIDNPNPPFDSAAGEITFPPAPPPYENGSAGEAMGLSVWGGVAIVVYALSCHHDTFYFLSSLARPPSTAARRRASSAAGGTPRVEGKRNNWPLATALGSFAATVIQLGWGLVGYLGLPDGGREGNLLASPALPRDDGWLILVRGMVLFAIVAQLEGNLKTAYVRAEKAIALVAGPSPVSSDEARQGRRRQSYSLVDSGEDGEQEWNWRRNLARVVVWLLVVGLSIVVCSWGDAGEGMVSVAEIVGAIVASLTGFLVPSLFFIALFHLRRPRSIFVTDPSDPSIAADTLLMRKERQVQRRLSGRRIWQDVLVFGGLLPFGAVVLLRGCVALAVKED